MYITPEEYTEFTGKKAPSNFKYLVEIASAELDAVTRFYFRFNELADDLKSVQFKKALIFQVDFMIENKITSVEQLNSKPDSVRIGDTTVSYNRTGTSAESSKRDSILSKDALNALRGTNLLYRGVGVHGRYTY